MAIISSSSIIIEQQKLNDRIWTKVDGVWIGWDEGHLAEAIKQTETYKEALELKPRKPT